MVALQALTKPPTCRPISDKILAWISLSRPPFHTVGILPFCLGTYLAWQTDTVFKGSVFFCGVVAVCLILLSTYHAGEYFDREEDTLSKAVFDSRFAGGSGVIPAGTLSRTVPLLTSIISLLAAFIVGLVLQFYYKTGGYTLLLGTLGALPGFFYSTRPIRLVERGIGELFIAFCYGWLPVATAFYLQTGYIHPLIHWLSLPIALTIFNVILLNEFQDYTSDRAVGKKNLLVRLKPRKGIIVFAAATISAWLAMGMAVWSGVSGKVWFFYLPILILSALILFLVYRKWHEKSQTLEILCGMNIAVNLGTTASLFLALS
ncbi:MAG: prenyltransferase [Syntrophaceae bacterium]|nr:prenyltransferase [Syntrophaceae bacterium]